MPKKVFKIKIILFLSLFLLFGVVSLAEAEIVGEKESFYVDPSYDLYSREELEAELIKISDSLYFYVGEEWWKKLSSNSQDEVKESLDDLAEEFENTIYPVLTYNYGSEWKPGIDNDEKMTVMVHPMKGTAIGYFNNGNEYSRYQNPQSNKREMVYLDARHIADDIVESYLAHEFVHLITFYQKEKLRNIQEEVWLNEARAEYAPTLCGYDLEYQGSNLQNRVNEFLKNPSDSIAEWQGAPEDYGALNLFTQYLVDHYGNKILNDSLHSSKKGIESINYALKKNGFKEDFSQIFTDWTIAVLINDCSLGEKYCYKNENLKNIRIVPESNFLPLTSESSLSVSYSTKNWAGNWQKIFGGRGTLTFEFEGGEGNDFEVAYLVCEDSNKCSVNFLTLDEEQKGEIILEEFNTKYTSLTIIPSLQSKLSDFNGIEPVYLFRWRATISNGTEEDKETELIKQLLAQIAYLKSEIAKVQTQIAAILGKTTVSCQRFDNNLYYGMMGNSEVRCLQQFLKNQGDEIYPEGLVTGNFLSLTKAAVIKFQQKYADDILIPWGLTSGTGYVGSTTRAKLNSLLPANSSAVKTGR